MFDYESLLSLWMKAVPLIRIWMSAKQRLWLYTSGTTRRPKACCTLIAPLCVYIRSPRRRLMSWVGGIRGRLAVGAIFQVNAWGVAGCLDAWYGRKQVFRAAFDPSSLLEAYQAERVTITGWFRTICWLIAASGQESHAPTIFPVLLF